MTTPVEKELETLFTKAVLDINTAMVDLTNKLMALEDMDIFGHLELYRITHEAFSRIEKAQKMLGETKQKLSYQVIPHIMSELKTDSLRYNGRNFIRCVRLDCYIKQDQMAAGKEWLKQAGLGGVIKEGVNAKTLSSVLGDYIEETGVMPPEDAISIHQQPYIQMRK